MRRVSRVLAFALPICFAADFTLAQTAAGAPLGAVTARASLELRGVALVPSDADPQGTPAAMAFDYLLASKEEQGLMFGAVVELLNGEDTWVEIPQEELSMEMQRFPPLGETERSGTRVLVTPTRGLTPGSYRVHVSAYLSGDTEADAINKTFAWQVLPPAAATKSGEESPAVAFERRFPIRYETWEAASETLGGRFPGGVGTGGLFHGMMADPVTGLYYARNRWYDPRSGVFLSEDAMGPIDSPNLYAYVGWQPNMARDPRGLYAEGGHYYTALYAALRVGFSPREAQQLAFYAQAPDEIADFDAKENFFAATGESLLNIGRRNQTEARDHMTSNQPAVHALTGGVAVTEMDRAIEGVLGAPTLAAAGVQIHRLGDSFAHRRLGDEFFLYDTGLGHAGDQTSPDTIQRRPDLYLEYARALTATLAARRGFSQADADGLAGQVASELVHIARLSPVNTDKWYKQRLSENEALEALTIDSLRGLIAQVGDQSGNGAAVAQILNYRPEASGAAGRTADELIRHYLRTQGQSGASAPGFSAAEIAGAFEYADQLYTAQRPR